MFHMDPMFLPFRPDRHTGSIESLFLDAVDAAKYKRRKVLWCCSDETKTEWCKRFLAFSCSIMVIEQGIIVTFELDHRRKQSQEAARARAEAYDREFFKKCGIASCNFD